MSKQQVKRASNDRSDATDLPLVEKAGAAVKALLAKGRETGYITLNDLNKALPSEVNSSEQIEDITATFSELLAIPGVGKKRAQTLISNRPYMSIEAASNSIEVDISRFATTLL